MESEKEESGPSPKRKRTGSIVKPRPNFFVAVQVSNPGIHQEVNALQKIITTKKPLFKSVLIKLITLHITLCTLHLSGNGDIKRAKTALKKLEINMKELLVKDPISLKFKGIGTFKNEVVFANIEPGEPLSRITDLHVNLVKALKDEGLIVANKFEPHLTIMKMSKDRTLRKQKIFKIPKDLYEEKIEMVFGDQTVRGVQLLSMGYRPHHTYYNCYHHFDLGSCGSELENHDDCCGVKSVYPNSLIELDTDTSDDESDSQGEEMFVEASEVLEEIVAVEDLESKDARKYLEGLEVEEDVFYEALEFSEENSKIEVVEVCSREIIVQGTDAQDDNVNFEASVQFESINVESSALQIKKSKIEDSEIQKVEVTSVKSAELVDGKIDKSDLEVEVDNVEDLIAEDKNMNLKASIIHNRDVEMESTAPELNEKIKDLGSEDLKTNEEMKNLKGGKEGDVKENANILGVLDVTEKSEDSEIMVVKANADAKSLGIQDGEVNSEGTEIKE